MKKRREARAANTKMSGQGAVVFRRLLHNKLAMTSLIVLVIIILSAVFAEYVAPYDYAKQSISERFQFPSWKHLMGTDDFGRDILSRIIYGGRISLYVSIMSVLSSLVVGGVLGATAAYFGGLYDSIVMRCMDVLMAIPAFLLAVSVSAALGTGVTNSIIALSIAGVPGSARIMRATVLGIKDQEFVEAAEANGASNP